MARVYMRTHTYVVRMYMLAQRDGQPESITSLAPSTGWVEA